MFYFPLSQAGGHYYSFIKARSNDPLITQPEQAGRWFEFNDHRVSDFDITRLDQECFGGEQVTEETNSWGYKTTSTIERFQNAYMLVYERSAKIQSIPAPAENSLSLDATLKVILHIWFLSSYIGNVIL